MTTEFSWRYVFAGETVIVAVILLLRRRLKRSPPAEPRRELDVVGVGLSALGLGLAVFGILKSSEWGWIEPRGALTIGGEEITPFGFSAVPFFILAGLGLPRPPSRCGRSGASARAATRCSTARC